MFRPSVNKTLLQSHRQGALITILYKAFMSETRHMSKTTRHGRQKRQWVKKTDKAYKHDKYNKRKQIYTTVLVGQTLA